jgi:hypothetical protein
MGTLDDRQIDEQVALCAECGRSLAPGESIPALDGTGHRCADYDVCDERKEARSAFSPAAA